MTRFAVGFAAAMCIAGAAGCGMWLLSHSACVALGVAVVCAVAVPASWAISWRVGRDRH